MTITEATQLIESAFQDRIPHTIWADLGCGSGTFTKALSLLLGEGSRIYAVDIESQHIKSSDTSNTEIEFVKLDFIHETLPFSNLDGILMANSLHYVQDKSTFIEQLKKQLKTNGQLIIVEYDTEKQNPWVPYPINFEKLSKTFSAHGFSPIKKIGERNSVYGPQKMYACSIKLS